MKKRLLHNKPIFIQLLQFSLVISLIPLLLVFGLLYRKMGGMVTDELSDYQDQIVAQYMQNLQARLEQYNNSLDYISKNTLIQENLRNASGNPYDKGVVITSEVYKCLLLDRQSEIRNCMIYSLVDDSPVYGASVTMMQEASREVWYLQERAMSENCFMYFTLDGTVPVLSFVQNIEWADRENLKQEQIGIVKLDLRVNNLFLPIAPEEGARMNYDVIVCGQDGNVFFSTDPEKKELPAALEKGIVASDTGNYIVSETELEDYGLRLLFVFDQRELQQRKREALWIVFPILAAVIAVVAVCAWVYGRDFSKRVGLLVSKFRRAETGNLAPSEPIGGRDEVAMLDEQFGHMLTTLEELIQTNFVQQLENEKAQLRNLQLQINPHFLYNTLETISSIAAVNHAFVVCDMCEKLGDIFRYSLGKNYGEYVTLEQELSHTKNYIFIQQIRYGNRCEVSYGIDVDAGSYRVLRFILQPVVENAILHGLVERQEKGMLTISAREEGGCLLIGVADDGVGMDAEQVAALRAYMEREDEPEEKVGSIGLRNVNRRLQLACGREYGLSIESSPGKGCSVTFRLPVLPAEENGKE